MATDDTDNSGDEGVVDGGDSMHDELLYLCDTAVGRFSRQGRSEQEQVYFKRMVDALSTLVIPGEHEEAWNAVSAESQEWSNSAAAAVEDDKEIEAPDGFVSRVKATHPKKSGAEELAEQRGKQEAKKMAAKGRGANGSAEKATTKGRGKTASETAPVAKKAAKSDTKTAAASTKKAAPKSPREYKSRGDNNPVALIRRHYIKNPSAKAADIVEMLDKKGLEATKSTIGGVRYYTMAVVSDLREMGLLKE